MCLRIPLEVNLLTHTVVKFMDVSAQTAAPLFSFFFSLISCCFPLLLLLFSVHQNPWKSQFFFSLIKKQSKTAVQRSRRRSCLLLLVSIPFFAFPFKLQTTFAKLPQLPSVCFQLQATFSKTHRTLHTHIRHNRYSGFPSFLPILAM